MPYFYYSLLSLVKAMSAHQIQCRPSGFHVTFNIDWLSVVNGYHLDDLYSSIIPPRLPSANFLDWGYGNFMLLIV
jgi:hypothetical protein